MLGQTSASRDIDRRRFLAGATALAVGAGGSVLPARGASLARLSVEGNKLLASGRPIRLTGVAVGDPLYIRANRKPHDFAELAQSWNANTVRISLHPGHWRHERHAAVAGLARDIGAARAAGHYVVLCWHAIGFPGRYQEPVDPAWGLTLDAYDTDPQLTEDFWTTMAASYGDDPGVLFELWNEPVADGRLWQSTGEHWPLLKALWLRLLSVIRQKSDAIVIVAGGRWAHDLKGVRDNLIDDPRVIYSWHCYPAEDRDRADRWINSLDGLPAVKPVIVTEWGFCSDCGQHLFGTIENFGQPFVRDVLEKHQLHSTAWCYSAGAAPQMLRSDGHPSEFGAFVRDYLNQRAREAAP